MKYITVTISQEMCHNKYNNSIEEALSSVIGTSLSS